MIWYSTAAANMPVSNTGLVGSIEVFRFLAIVLGDNAGLKCGPRVIYRRILRCAVLDIDVAIAYRFGLLFAS